MPALVPTLPPSQGYPTGTYPTVGTWGYPVTPASPATSGRLTPTVSSITPTTKAPNTGTFDLTVRGTNFTAESVITIATVAQPTQVVNDRTLVTTQNSAAQSGAKAVTVATGTLIVSPGATLTYA